MVTRIRLAVVVALYLALVLVVPVRAGGWALITLDQLPGDVVAGEPLNIGFTVRQHGRTPVDGLTPTITASLPGSTEKVIAIASAEGKIGHYTATLTFPESGVWDWTISAFATMQMPPLTVVAGSGQNNAQASGLPQVASWSMLGIVGLAGCLAGIILAFRRKMPLAVPVLIAGLALSIFGFSSASKPVAYPQVQAASNISQSELGKQLFIVKGCTTCHFHQDINRSKDNTYVDVGPSLTNYASFSPEILQAWLKDPASVKPETQMPNLELSQDEIEVLVAFLTSK
ncbi:MAG: hypothetical protein CVU39_27745 [Chloroflexi bacterium HGW-Chloroflexi-10]|nr:MAG: hypothetical protein CVU39_27745 [Chloroflexi bacterium HGW-Chloroflexi-10]